MKIAVMQPYFMPYIGYFQLIKSVDKFIFFDDVQYIKKGWINRNKMLINNKESTFSLSIKKDSSNLNINQRFFGDQIEKECAGLIKGIERAYKKAPEFNRVMPLINEIFAYDKKQNISEFIINSIDKICRYMNLEREFIKSSDINKDNNLKGQDKIIDIVRRLNGDIYINSIGGQKLYSKKVFLENGVNLFFLQSGEVVYKQFDDKFISNLSILDVLMFNSERKVTEALNKYILV